MFLLHGYSDRHKFHGKPKPKPQNSPKSNNVFFENASSISVHNYAPSTSGSSEFFEAQEKQILQLIQDGFKELNITPGPSAPWNSADIILSPGNSHMYTCYSCCTMLPESITWILDSVPLIIYHSFL